MSLLIFAFIVVVIGGTTSLTGCAIASAAVGLIQQFANYYTIAGLGDIAVVAVLAAVLAVLLSLPFSTLHVPGVFEHALNSPSPLRLLALCLVFGGLATSYDLLRGRVGLLSFGHALYFACGAYAAALLMSVLELPLLWAALVSVVGGTLLALILGAVSLRVNGIALAMVTLAFAEAGSILISRDPGRWTGGGDPPACCGPRAGSWTRAPACTHPNASPGCPRACAPSNSPTTTTTPRCSPQPPPWSPSRSTPLSSRPCRWRASCSSSARSGCCQSVPIS